MRIPLYTCHPCHVSANQMGALPTSSSSEVAPQFAHNTDMLLCAETHRHPKMGPISTGCAITEKPEGSKEIGNIKYSV
jgi:hypothetical protein